jgi:hypothetical protein
VSLPQKNKFNPAFPLVDGQGNATQVFRDYMIKLDALVAAMAAGNLAGLVNAANDAAAAAAGVQIGQAYRSGSVVHIRVV